MEPKDGGLEDDIPLLFRSIAIFAAMIQIPLKLEDLSSRFLGWLERFTGFVSLKAIYNI